jgi:hypothetical protein
VRDIYAAHLETIEGRAAGPIVFRRSNHHTYARYDAVVLTSIQEVFQDVLSGRAITFPNFLLTLSYPSRYG